MKLSSFASNLFLHEIVHLIFGILAFLIIFWIYDKLDLAVISFLVSFAIDSDHYLEAVVIHKFNVLSIIKHKHNCWREAGKMTILFHSWELVILLLVLGKVFGFMPLAISISLSAAFHYLVDTVIYSLCVHMPVYQYFLLYRAYYRFDFWKLYHNGKGKNWENEK